MKYILVSVLAGAIAVLFTSLMMCFATSIFTKSIDFEYSGIWLGLSSMMMGGVMIFLVRPRINSASYLAGY